MFTTINKRLAVKQLQISPPKASMKAGIAMVQQNVETVVTELLFDAEIDGGIYLKGSKVAFLGSSSLKPWNKEVLTHDGLELVLAPIEDVVMISLPVGA